MISIQNTVDMFYSATQVYYMPISKENRVIIGQVVGFNGKKFREIALLCPKASPKQICHSGSRKASSISFSAYISLS